MLRFKNSIIILLLCASLPLTGQTRKPRNLVTFDYKPFHFGYSVGFNTFGFMMLPSIDSVYLLEVTQHPGLNINLITNLKLTNNLSLRALPGIQFGQRDVTITDRVANVSSGAIKIESVFVDLPVLIKYRSDRVNNYAPYLIAGINPRAELLGSELKEWKRSQRLIKALDIHPELGVGIDFYLEKVKVATELKFAVGMLNIYRELDPDDPATANYSFYAKGINLILSRMMIFSIHVE